MGSDGGRSGGSDGGRLGADGGRGSCWGCGGGVDCATGPELPPWGWGVVVAGGGGGGAGGGDDSVGADDDAWSPVGAASPPSPGEALGRPWKYWRVPSRTLEKFTSIVCHESVLGV